MPFSDWLRYSRSILWCIVSSVATDAGAALCFRSAHEADLDESFERLVDLYVAKCNLGEVKLERVGLQLSPIAVRDMRGGPLGNCRASLGISS